jgi:hypothetical protein
MLGFGSNGTKGGGRVRLGVPLQFLLLTVSGCMTREDQHVRKYLLAQNAVLRGSRAVHRDARRRSRGASK